MILKVLIFVILFVFTLPGLAAIQVTFNGDDNYPPYSYKENGKNRGIYVELLKKVFSKIDDYDLKIVLVPWKRGLKSLKDGDVIALFPPYVRKKQRPYIKHYSHMVDENVVVYCNNKVAEEKTFNRFPQDFFGTKFGNNLGYASGGTEFIRAVKAGKIKTEEVRSTALNLKKLSIGRVDCYINDRISILFEMSKMKKRGNDVSQMIKLVKTLTVEEGSIGYGADTKFPYQADLIQKVEAEIKRMKAAGEINQLIKF